MKKPKDTGATVPDNISEPELLELVATRVKEAITDTQKTRKALSRSLNKMERR